MIYKTSKTKRSLYTNYKGLLHENRYSIYNFIVLDKTERDSLIGYLSKMLHNTSTTLSSSVMVHKEVQTPRYKFKDYFEENNIVKSRYGKATSIVLNKQLVTDFLKLINHLSPKNIVLLENLQENDPNFSILSNYTKTKLGRYVEDIDITPGSDYLIEVKDPKDLPRLNGEQLYSYSLYRERKIEDLYEFLTTLKSDNKSVIWEEDLLPILNKDGFDLDDDYLETLDGMFQSRKQDNIDMALEMMCNVDLDSNFLTIALLLNKYREQFSWGSGLSLKRHRGFKSVLNYFESNGVNFDVDFRQFCKELLVKFEGDAESTTIITNFLLGNINRLLSERVWGMGDNCDPIQLESIKLK